MVLAVCVLDQLVEGCEGVEAGEGNREGLYILGPGIQTVLFAQT